MPFQKRIAPSCAFLCSRGCRSYMKENVAQLGVDHVDLALLHHPCDRPGMDEKKIDNVLWTAMQTVQKMGASPASLY